MSFPARYSGWCPSCGERWQEGDQIEHVDDGSYSGWAHASCPDPLPATRPGEVACQDCWLIHPKGACDL